MKTAIAFHNTEDLTSEYYILDGDHFKFDKIFINATDNDEGIESELNILFYDEEGRKMHRPIPFSDFCKQAHECDFFIQCGFIC